MTASVQLAGAAGTAPARVATPLRWCELGCTFEIRSSDEAIIDMAKAVFDATSPISESVHPDRAWSIELLDGVSGTEEWLVREESGPGQAHAHRSATRDRALLRIEHDSVEFLIGNQHEGVALHAAVLTRNGRGVAIVGPSLAGKSTLATALWRAGWSLMADDVVVIDPARRLAFPAPRRVSLRFESRSLVGEDFWARIRASTSCIETAKGLFFHPHEVSGPRLRETPLAAFFFLARRGVETPAAVARRINPAAAAVALVPYGFNIRELPLVDSLRRVSPLTAAIPAFDLGRGELAAMIAAIEKSVA